MPPPLWSDVQGLVVSSYGHLDAASYLLLRIEDPEAARAWLGRIAPFLTTAAEGSRRGPSPCLGRRGSRQPQRRCQLQRSPETAPDRPGGR